MTKGREKSDGLIVPEGRRKPVPTARTRGGKGATEREAAGQLDLHLGTAENPRGAEGGADGRRRPSAPLAVPKPRGTTKKTLRPMTMEEVAARNNLVAAFRQVASNKGAAGPDGQSVAEVRRHLGRVLDRLHRELLAGTYRPGLIRRVWIPKPGGERGLGIPNVVDRIVGQAVHQVLSPHYEPTFHASSHGFRPGRSGRSGASPGTSSSTSAPTSPASLMRCCGPLCGASSGIAGCSPSATGSSPPTR